LRHSPLGLDAPVVFHVKPGFGLNITVCSERINYM